MNKRERAIVKRQLEGVYQEWHVCALATKDAEQMGLAPGRLCDNCRSMVAARMKQIESALLK